MFESVLFNHNIQKEKVEINSRNNLLTLNLMDLCAVFFFLNREKASHIVSKRVDDFRERTQPQLGKVHDPIKDTMKVAKDHIFGVLFKPDEYGAGDLIHGRIPGNYLQGHEHQRAILAAVRQHLKKVKLP